MKIEHISVSRFQTFSECQEKYKFKYHLKVPTTEPEKYYFAYGKMIHKIGEEFARRKDSTLFQECVNDVLTGKIEIEPGKQAPKIQVDYQKAFQEHLKNLKSFILNVGFDVQDYIEYQFHYDLMPPKNYFATGFIDRLVLKDGKFFIIDYKTTKKGPFRKDKVSVMKDLQLRMYAKVVQKDFGAAADKIHCCLYYLDGGELVGATYCQNSIDEAEKQMLDAYIMIHDMDPAKVYGRVGEHCNRCEFKKMCRFFNSANCNPLSLF